MGLPKMAGCFVVGVFSRSITVTGTIQISSKKPSNYKTMFREPNDFRVIRVLMEKVGSKDKVSGIHGSNSEIHGNTIVAFATYIATNTSGFVCTCLFWGRFYMT